MAIDPNILLQARQPQLSDPLEVAGRAMSLKQLQMQNQALQRDQSDKMAYNDILKRNTSVGSDGKLAVNKGATLSELSKTNPQAAMSLQEKWASEDFDQVKKRTEMSKQLAWSMTPENYSVIRNQAIQMGIPHADKLPDFYDPGIVRQLQMSTLNADEQLKQMNSDRDYKLKQTELTQKQQEAKAKGQKDAVTAASDLRKERSSLPTTKATQEISAAYNKIQAAAKNPSAAGDMSLIFGYMKMLDPGSTVREGEFANAQNAAGIDSRVVNAYNNILSGQRLSPQQRQDFMGQAGGLYKSQMAVQNQVDSQFSNMATRSGIDPKDVLLNFEAQSPETTSSNDQPQVFKTNQIKWKK